MNAAASLVAVASFNPVKITAVEAAFAAVWPQQRWEVRGVLGRSGVSAQPMSDEESIRGARERARYASMTPSAAFGVGLEGGLQQSSGWWFDRGWVVVQDAAGVEGIGASGSIVVPPRLMVLLDQGLELGEAIDVIFGTTNSKQAQGHYGLMTNNLITRTAAYTEGVIAALARFVHPELFTP